MRLGVAYNLYDGEELLTVAALSIRPVADFITVTYQEISNIGERKKESVVPLLSGMKDAGIIDDYECYAPNLKLSAEDNEKRKRIAGMKQCERNGCDYFITLDVDEFFRHQEVEVAKNFMERYGFEISAVSIIEYVKEPTNRLLCNYMFSPDKPLDYTFYCPFICKIKKPEMEGVFPCLTDPTRHPVCDGRFYLFPKHVIAMHHMSTIRRDLETKFRNSTSTVMGDVDRHRYQKRVKEDILAYQYKENRPVPSGYDFIDGFPVLKVGDEFGVREAMSAGISGDLQERSMLSLQLRQVDLDIAWGVNKIKIARDKIKNLRNSL